MKIIYLIDSTGKEIIGSDGMMKIDGRFNLQSTRRAVQERNERKEKNFPHLVASAFKFKGTEKIIKISGETA